MNKIKVVKKKWGKEDVDILKNIYNNYLWEDILLHFPYRTKKSIYRKAEELKLIRSKNIKFKELGLSTLKKWKNNCFKNTRKKIKEKFYNGDFFYINQIGKNNPNWKGINYKSSLEKRLRACYYMKKWKKLILLRDKYTCLKCRKIKKIQTHHIKMFSQILKEKKINTYEKGINCKELWDINNGISICKFCHIKIRGTEKNYYNFFKKLIKKYNITIKKWGFENLIINSKYCGKVMGLLKGYRCSMHYHKNKDETFYIIRGRVLLETYQNENKKGYKKKVLQIGDSYRVMPNIPHSFTGLEDSEIIEFSTHHEDSDSYRLPGMLSGKVEK